MKTKAWMSNSVSNFQTVTWWISRVLQVWHWYCNCYLLLFKHSLIFMNHFRIFKCRKVGPVLLKILYYHDPKLRVSMNQKYFCALMVSNSFLSFDFKVWYINQIPAAMLKFNSKTTQRGNLHRIIDTQNTKYCLKFFLHN